VTSLLDRINEWGYALSQSLHGRLEAGSLSAVLVVFAAGVLTSFTPCVYPMIPVTVTYIGGASGGDRRRAVGLSLTYVLGLAIVYAALGVAAALVGKIFGEFTRTPWVYGIVGVIIAALGLSMLDVIPLPPLLGGVQTAGSRRGGYLGALLIGTAAGFVAAPCTAPVLGLLLAYVGNTRDVVWGGTLLLVFALGLSLLLMLLGMFSGLLSSLPRAGGWMSVVKKCFGVAMLVIAVWFFFQAAVMLRTGSRA
jgi:thiol:disulfide interchange protein DsbD